MQAQLHADDNPRAAVLIGAMLVGSALVLNAFLAPIFYAANPVAGEISAFLGALLLAYPILQTALRDLWRGHVFMNELVALAVLAAMATGDYKTAGIIAFFMLLALVIETRSAEGAHQAIENLIRMTPSTANRIGADGRDTTVPVSELIVGDSVRVKPGENVPADGLIRAGRTTLNEATITGESLPRDKIPGDDVFAGTQNLTGMIEVEVTRLGEDTTLGQVQELIRAAEQSKLPMMRLIDRYARFYTPVVLMLSALVWFFTDDWNRVIALLIIACPCAFILATPTAMVAALSAAARLGILVKNVQDLETASRIDTFILDKTGTLTSGHLGVSRLAPHRPDDSSSLLFEAGSAERFSKHPAALALQRLATEVGMELTDPEDFHEEPGQGIRACVNGKTVLSGRITWLQANGINDPQLTADHQQQVGGLSAIFVATDGTYRGWIGLEDQVRPEAAESIRRMRTLQVKRVAMVTGDRQGVADRVARSIDCPEVKAECLPQEKVAFVEAARQAGFHVAFVGDGVNDAPALAAGDIGIAMGAAGSDVAIHSATIALMNNDLRRLPFIIELSRAARTVIHQNIAIGGLFIVGGLILSGLGLLPPVLAAIIHNAGSLIVVFNSARLIRRGEELER
jgi:Zn2+/Cd2+-exporting ATPase